MNWISKISTESTFPPPGTFSECMSGLLIATIMSRPDVSPFGLRSAISMVVYFKNRGGKNLTAKHKRHLDDAIEILGTWLRKFGNFYSPISNL